MDEITITFVGLVINTTFDVEKRADLAVPTFPPVFTMYIVAPYLRSAEIVYHVDSVNQFYRIDYPGYSILQKYGFRYTFLTGAIITPEICYNTTAKDPLIKLPIFSRHVGNATMDDGVLTGIWVGISDPTSTPVWNEYWYFNPLTGVPHFFLDRKLFGAKITLFQDFVGDPNIFNEIPPLCIGMSIKQTTQPNLKETVRDRFKPRYSR